MKYSHIFGNSLTFVLLSAMLRPTSLYNTPQVKKEQIAAMFNNIAKTYDFLNHLLSFGIDAWWRKKAIQQLLDDHPQSILDVATGTGDFAFQAIEHLNPKRIVGVDLASNMLAIAHKKIMKRNLQEQFTLALGDAEQLPFKDNDFDAVITAYGVRNFENLERGLQDMFRVLKPGGKVLILEFSQPKIFPIKQAYHFYFNHILPKIGKILSKDSSAYSYLPASVALFPEGPIFCQHMSAVGFRNTQHLPLAFGICSIYTGTK